MVYDTLNNLQREVNRRLARSCGEGVLRMTLMLLKWYGRRNWTVYQEEVVVLTARPTKLPDLACAHMRCVYRRGVVAVIFQRVSPFRNFVLALCRFQTWNWGYSLSHASLTYSKDGKILGGCSIIIIAANRAGTFITSAASPHQRWRWRGICGLVIGIAGSPMLGYWAGGRIILHPR